MTDTLDPYRCSFLPKTYSSSSSSNSGRAGSFPQKGGAAFNQCWKRTRMIATEIRRAREESLVDQLNCVVVICCCCCVAEEMRGWATPYRDEIIQVRGRVKQSRGGTRREKRTEEEQKPFIIIIIIIIDGAFAYWWWRSLRSCDRITRYTIENNNNEDLLSSSSFFHPIHPVLFF